MCIAKVIIRKQRQTILTFLLNLQRLLTQNDQDEKELSSICNHKLIISIRQIKAPDPELNCIN